MGGLLGIADLANNIASATKGLATAFGLANPDPSFPQSAANGITSKFQREHWYQAPNQGLYAFSVEPVSRGTVSEFPAFVDNIKSLFTGFFSPGDDFGEFKLPITPQEITQTEDFAVTIKPTQGGTVVNHSGNKYKTLNISGTTGVQPFRGLLGVYKDTGLAIGKPDELKYRSGYEVFQHFRNWMKAYHEHKTKPGTGNLRMLFRNYKDWEFLYVEPIKFTMKRDASKPLLYNYMIQFKVLGVLTIDKPLFDLAVSKLGEISAAVVNTYVLIKKNKDVTESITGTISDFEQSMNNLKYALKSANKEEIKASEITKQDTEKLSYKETLQLLGVMGNAMAKSGTDVRASESNGTECFLADPLKKGNSLTSLTPASTNVNSAKAEVRGLLDSEPALMTGISLDTLPPRLKADLAKKQMEAALISRVKVQEIQKSAQDISDKLAEGIGLSDATYNSIFGITPTINTDIQGEITDDQFEMLYALSRTNVAICGILASDEMFDTNGQLFKQTRSANGADTVGQGIFSFPDPSTGIKEGYVSAGMTLEDLAFAELGDTSRWTEIAELNGLKSPYIVDRIDTPSPNFFVKSQNYNTPTFVNNLQIGDFFLIPTVPTPISAWSGKSNYIGQFTGGDRTVPANWVFIYPDEGTLIQIISTSQYLRYNNGTWVEIDANEFTLDGVLKPGDKIKIPSGATPPLSTKVQGPRDNIYTNALPPSEKALAVDLRLTDQMDLDLTPSGDLNVVFGVENAAQAIVLKLLYSKGALKKFPSIGSNLSPGKKVPDIATLRADITTSLLQDNRIKDVTKINIVQENGTVSLSFEVFFHDVQQPIPITIPV